MNTVFEREIKDLRRLLTGDDISKMEFSIQQLLYSLFVVRINQHNLFSDILKSVDNTLIVCFQRFHRTI